MRNFYISLLAGTLLCTAAQGATAEDYAERDKMNARDAQIIKNKYDYRSQRQDN